MINLNNLNEFTHEGLAAIIAQGNNGVRNQLRITHDGILGLYPITGSSNTDDYIFRLEAFPANSDFVGPAAAADTYLISMLYNKILRSYPNDGEAYDETN